MQPGRGTRTPPRSKPSRLGSNEGLRQLTINLLARDPFQLEEGLRHGGTHPVGPIRNESVKGIDHRNETGQPRESCRAQPRRIPPAIKAFAVMLDGMHDVRGDALEALWLACGCHSGTSERRKGSVML